MNVSGTGVTVANVVVGNTTSLTANFLIDPTTTGGPRTVTVTTAAGASGAQIFTIIQNPAITSASIASFTVGTPGTFTVTTMGIPDPAISVSGTLPAGVTFVDNGNGTGTLSGTPAAGTGGTYPLSFTAVNSVGTATQSFTLTVNPGTTVTITTAAGTSGPQSFTITLPSGPRHSLLHGQSADLYCTCRGHVHHDSNRMGDQREGCRN